MDEAVNVAEDDVRNGDVVLLQAEDLVPADLRLVEARGLEIDEWELTGEIAPVGKRVGGDAFVYRGSRVVRGNGKGVVVATGANTEYEEILKQRWEQTKHERPSLIRARYLILLVILLPPLVVFSSRHGHYALIGLLYLAIAVVVVLLQNGELFKYVLTAIEARKIERQNIQIRDVTALDLVSRLDIVCLDKTGVLTTRHLEVKRIHFADETPDIASFSSDRKVVHLTRLGCALCNDVAFAEKMKQANSIDRALISFAAKNGMDLNETALRYNRIYDKPFDSEDRYMATGFQLNGENLYFAKGDPEVVLKMCRSYITASGIEKNADADFRQSIRAQANSINREGDIAIALAYSSGTSETAPLHYTYLCLIQLDNPLNLRVPDVVNKLKQAGIRTVMLTGDRLEAALAIGKEAGIDSRYPLTGKDIAAMALAEVTKQCAYVSVFARLWPSQKGIVVRLFQNRETCVAMVGDGANDAIALRAADVGISFMENASPFATRVSQLLINDLADLLTIIRGARRIKRRAKYLALLRVLVLVSALFGLYAWMLGAQPIQT